MQGRNPESQRRHNARLVLSLLRAEGPLARHALAERTGLSAQSVGTITRELMARGLVAAGERQRGRVGQPTEPLALNPEGAFFLGLKVGRRSGELVMIDYVGVVRGRIACDWDLPRPDRVHGFALEAAARLREGVPAGRLEGLGIAMPFRLWDWAEGLGDWRETDLAGDLAAATGVPCRMANDASCACAAELVLGRRDLPANFVHVSIGHFAGGGLVLDGALRLGTTGNAGALGSVPVPDSSRPAAQLLERASLARLAASGEGFGAEARARLHRRWRREAAEAIAFAALSAAALAEIDAVVIDGAMTPAERAALAEAVVRALSLLPSAGITPPQVLEGSFGPLARAMGAAVLVLADGHLNGIARPQPPDAPPRVR